MAIADLTFPHHYGPGVFVDATQTYLLSIYELEEESGVPPLRVALAARLGLSRSSVSQYVARLAHEGLVTVSGQRGLELTEAGRRAAVVIVRRHRLAERLLADVIGLEWELCHLEATRWQHVLGERVERRLLQMLDDPRFSPFGEPIPGLDELDSSIAPVTGPAPVPLDDLARDGGGPAVLSRILARVQGDPRRLARLRAAGAVPGSTVEVAAGAGPRYAVRGAAGTVELDADTSRSILVIPGHDAA
jgi:DtxR family Mn-dependent transcriptional regulator